MLGEITTNINNSSETTQHCVSFAFYLVRKASFSFMRRWRVYNEGTENNEVNEHEDWIHRYRCHGARYH